MTLDWNGLLLPNFTSDEEMLKDMYINQNMSIEAIARKIGVSKQTIRYRLKMYKVSVRSRGGKNHVKRPTDGRDV